MIGRFRKSNSGRDGTPVFFEAVTQLPPFVETESTQPLMPVPPEDNVSGAWSAEAEASTSGTLSESETSEGALGARVMKGVSWTLAGTLWTQGLGVLRTVVLARLLTQADFGVAAMALTVIGALYTLTNTSAGASVISARFEDDEALHRYTNLIWTMEIGRGAVISVSLLILSLPFTLFYHEPRLFPMLLALALTPLCTSFQNVGLHLQSRRVEMKALALHGLYSSTISVAATLILALATHNYWALVWGQVAGAFATTALSFVFSSYRPRLYWERTVAKRAFGYGKYQFVIGLANYALTMMDNVVVGYWLGKEVLGTYVVAYSFCTMARMIVNNAFNTVLFPAFAAAGREADPERLRALIERAFTLGTLALTALLTPLLVFAPAVLRVFYGTKWHSAVVPMRLLLLAGFFAGVLSLFSAFFDGLDRFEYESKGKVWDALLFLALLCPLTLKFGAPGAALAGVIAWAAASLWRRKWGNDLVPGSVKRLPYLMISALLIGALACPLAMLPWAGVAGGWLRAFQLSTPSLGVAWAQLLLGAPLVSLFCVAAFALLHPVARQELAALKNKVAVRMGRA